MGLKLFKFHFFLHLVDNIKHNCVNQNTSSGPGESCHKTHCKQPARNTQRIAERFDVQIGKQYADNLLIDCTFVQIQKVNDINQQDSSVSMIFFMQNNIYYQLETYLTNATFADFIKRKRDAYEEDNLDLTPEELMTQANTKYLNLQRAGIWMKATADQEKIIALEAKIEAFKRNNNKSKHQQEGKNNKKGKDNNVLFVYVVKYD